MGTILTNKLIGFFYLIFFNKFLLKLTPCEAATVLCHNITWILEQVTLNQRRRRRLRVCTRCETAPPAGVNQSVQRLVGEGKIRHRRHQVCTICCQRLTKSDKQQEHRV